MKLSEVKKSSALHNPMYALERKLNLKPLIIFTVISAVLLFCVVPLYFLMESISESLLVYFENNETMKELLIDAMGMQSITSYFVLQGGQVWGLLGAIYAAYLGGKLVSGDLKKNSFEVLYTQNLSRTKILKAKFVRMLVNLLFFNLVCGIVGIISMLIFAAGKFSVLNYLLYLLIVTIMTIQIGALSFALACFFRKKYTTFLSIILALMFYFFASTGLLGAKFEIFNYLGPFNLALTDVITYGVKEINFASLALWVIVPIITLYFAVKNFKNADLV